MTVQNTVRTSPLAFVLPILIILTSVVLTMSPLLTSHKDLAIGITYDLTILSPLLYLLLIRKQPIPKITAVPVFVLGVVLASVLLPENQQFHLGMIKSYLLPLVEMVVLATISYKAYSTAQSFKAQSQHTQDFYEAMKASAAEVVGNIRVSKILATEAAMLYYALFSWRRKKASKNEFTGYKENGFIPLFGVILFIVIAETLILHVLLVKWNVTVAWILSISSVYAGAQLLGHIKAVTQRHTTLNDHQLLLKYGLFSDMPIEIRDIERIEATTRDVESEGIKIEQLALLKGLETHNVAIHLKRSHKIETVYGITRDCHVVLLYVDTPEEFVTQIEKQLV